MDSTNFIPDKQAARKNFDGNETLFESCWRQYRQYLRGSINNPTCQDDVDQWLDSIASEKVNNPKSPFYIHG